MPTVFVNGKYLAQRTSGVQRVAAEVLRALDTLLLEHPCSRRWVLLVPAGAAVPPLQRIDAKITGWRWMPLHVWEQFLLPFAARHGRLMNLSGSAPLLPRGQVCTFHDAAVFDHPEAYTRLFVAWYRLLFRRQSRVGSRILTVSKFAAGRLEQALRLSSGRLRVMHNGADHMLGCELDPSVIDRFGLGGRRILLVVANANPTKNLMRLVQAFNLLEPEDDVRLVIVGAANKRVFSGEQMPQVHLRVVRTGPLADAPLATLYRHATALVCPSIYEGFGLPPLEAMASGCPVAVARAGALPEVCGDAALYFDAYDVSDMASTLRRLLDDDGLRARLSSAGRERAAVFRWKDSAATVLETMDALG